MQSMEMSSISVDSDALYSSLALLMVMPALTSGWAKMEASRAVSVVWKTSMESRWTRSRRPFRSLNCLAMSLFCSMKPSMMHTAVDTTGTCRGSVCVMSGRSDGSRAE